MGEVRRAGVPSAGTENVVRPSTTAGRREVRSYSFLHLREGGFEGGGGGPAEINGPFGPRKGAVAQRAKRGARIARTFDVGLGVGRRWLDPARGAGRGGRSRGAGESGARCRRPAVINVSRPEDHRSLG